MFNTEKNNTTMPTAKGFCGGEFHECSEIAHSEELGSTTKTPHTDGKWFKSMLLGGVFTGGYYEDCEFHGGEFHGGKYVRCTFHLYEAIQAALSPLWWAQQELVDAVVKWYLSDELRARTTCPVAFGKTYLMPFIINAIANETTLDTFGIGLPWISLADQTVIRTLEKLKSLSNNYKVILVHSGDEHEKFGVNGSGVEGEFNDMVLKVTANDSTVIVEQYNEWKNDGHKVIFIYLYKSAQKLFDILNEKGIEIGFGIHDEAHNLSRDSENLFLIAARGNKVYSDKLDDIDNKIKNAKIRERAALDARDKKKIQATMKELANLAQIRNTLLKNGALVPNPTLPISKVLSMTATPTSSDQRGARALENTEIFGDEIFKFTFADLCKEGRAILSDLKIITPDEDVLLELKNSGLDEEDIYSAAYIIGSLLWAKDDLGEGVGIKEFIHVTSIKDIDAICGEVNKKQGNMTNVEYATYRRRAKESGLAMKNMIKKYTGIDFNIYGITGYHTTEERVKMIEKFGADKNSIMVNCRTMSEGVDFPDANVGLVLRSADTISIIQMYGRQVRITEGDQKKIASGELTPNENYEGYEKDKALFFIGDRINTDETQRQLFIMANAVSEYMTKDFIEGESSEDWNRRLQRVVGGKKYTPSKKTRFIDAILALTSMKNAADLVSVYDWEVEESTTVVTPIDDVIPTRK